MKEIKFDGHALKVPTGWSDVTLGEYESWQKQELNTQNGQMQFIADICKISIDELRAYPSDFYNLINKTLAFAFETEFEPQHTVTMQGEKWFLAYSDKLSLGEWVDVDSVLNDEDEPHKLSQMLSILCRPVGETYNAEVAEKRIDIFKQMTCDQALPLASFFLSRNTELEETFHHYSQVATEADQFLKDTKTFARSGTGTKRLPIWQRIKFYFLTKLLEKQLSRSSDLCSID